MNAVLRAFDTLPPSEWSDGPGSFLDPARAIRPVAFPEEAPPLRARPHRPATGIAERRREADARAVALWADPRWHARGQREALAAEHGYASVKSAEGAVSSWRKRCTR